MDETKTADALKALLAAAAAPDPFARVSGTPHLDAYQATAPVISPADLQALNAGIDKAVKDKSTAAMIGAVVGQVVSMAKMFAIALLVVVFASGCTTPPSIAQAHRVEGDALAAYHADVIRALDAYEADLTGALVTQVEIIRDYELRLAAGADGKVDLAKVKSLLDGAKGKKTEIEQHLAEVRGKVGGADANYAIALAIHQRLGQYLDTPGVSADDAAKLIREVANIRAGGGK